MTAKICWDVAGYAGVLDEEINCMKMENER